MSLVELRQQTLLLKLGAVQEHQHHNVSSFASDIELNRLKHVNFTPYTTAGAVKDGQLSTELLDSMRNTHKQAMIPSSRHTDYKYFESKTSVGTRHLLIWPEIPTLNAQTFQTKQRFTPPVALITNIQNLNHQLAHGTFSYSICQHSFVHTHTHTHNLYRSVEHKTQLKKESLIPSDDYCIVYMHSLVLQKKLRKHSRECKPPPRLTTPCTDWLTIDSTPFAMHNFV